jgi:hypothetical protein
MVSCAITVLVLLIVARNVGPVSSYVPQQLLLLVQSEPF